MLEKLEGLGKKALVLPIGICLALCLVLSLALTPMLRADPHNVPFAIVNLDKGCATIAGSSNIGETLTDNLLSGEGTLAGSDDEADSSSSMQGALAWTKLSSEDELMEALTENEYCGGIVIPANFTSQQMNSAVGLGDAPEITVYLNKGRNAQLASSMQTTLESTMLKAGIACDVQMVNDAYVGDGTMSDMLVVQMLVMPLFMLMMISSIATSVLLWHKDALKLREKGNGRAAAVQALFVLALSAIVAGLALFVDTVAGGLSIPAGPLFLLSWLASFCCMLCFVGLCDVALPLGALVAIGTFALGMGTAMLAPEMLPEFWVDWIYPWAPQAHMGNAVRSIIYLGQAPAQSDLLSFAAFGTVGLLGLVGAVLMGRKSNSPKEVY